MQLDQALQNIFEYKHRGNYELCISIKVIREHKTELQETPVRMNNIILALQTIKWDEGFILKIPHDYDNPGVCADIAILDLHDEEIPPNV